MKSPTLAALAALIIRAASPGFADIPQGQVLLEVRIAEARIFDLSDFGTGYHFQGNDFDGVLNVTQYPDWTLSATATLTDFFSQQVYQAPLIGRIDLDGLKPAAVQLAGQSPSGDLEVEVEGNGDVSGIDTRITIQTQRDPVTIVLKLVPYVREYGVDISITPTSNLGNTVMGTGLVTLPIGGPPLVVQTNQTVDGRRFSFSATNQDFSTKIVGIGRLPVIGRLFRNNEVRIATELLIFTSPRILQFDTDD